MVVFRLAGKREGEVEERSCLTRFDLGLLLNTGVGLWVMKCGPGKGIGPRQGFWFSL